MKKFVSVILMFFLASALAAQEQEQEQNPEQNQEQSLEQSQDSLPRTAVYVSGDLGVNEKNVLGTRILTAIVKNGNSVGSERSGEFLAEIEREAAKTPGSVLINDQICAVGKQFGVRYVCMADITSAFDEYHVSARMIDVETAVVIAVGKAHGPLKTINDLAHIADAAVKSMRGQAETSQQASPAPPAVHTAPDLAVVHTPPPAAYDPPPAPAVHTPPPAAYDPPPAPVVQTPAPAMALSPGTKPSIGIYITSGGSGGMVAKIVTPLIANGLVKALSGGGKINTANKTDDINKVLGGQQSGDLSPDQMRTVANQLNVHFLCVAKINFSGGGSFGMKIQLLNTAAGRKITSLDLANLDKSKIPPVMLDIARELLKTVTEMTGVSTQASADEGGADEAYSHSGRADRNDGMTDNPKESGKKMSYGISLVYTGDYGGGIVWKNSREYVGMPYNGFGAYVFLDLIYAVVFFGETSGGGKWKSNNVTDSYYLPDMTRTYVNFGAFVKFPFQLSESDNTTLFTLLGFDYYGSVAGTSTTTGLKYDNWNKDVFDGNDGRPEAGDLSALWFKIGGGLMYGISPKMFLRFESLYGVRYSNKFEEYQAHYGRHDAQARQGHGLDLKAGIGFNF